MTIRTSLPKLLVAIIRAPATSASAVTRIAPQREIAEPKFAGHTLAREHSFLRDQYFLICIPVF